MKDTEEAHSLEQWAVLGRGALASGMQRRMHGQPKMSLVLAGFPRKWTTTRDLDGAAQGLLWT